MKSMTWIRVRRVEYQEYLEHVSQSSDANIKKSDLVMGDLFKKSILLDPLDLQNKFFFTCAVMF